MRAVTIKEAKAHLNELIEAAIRGEQVVLMRGSAHVATLVPITQEDIELAPRLNDQQAERLWRTVRETTNATFASADEAVKHLKRVKRPRRKR